MHYPKGIVRSDDQPFRRLLEMDKSKRDISIVMGLAGFVVLVIILIGITITISPSEKSNGNSATTTIALTYDATTTTLNSGIIFTTTSIINSAKSAKKMRVNASPDKFYEGDPKTKGFYPGDNLNLLVSNGKGDPVEGARIEFDNAYAGSTNENGKFQVQNLESGNHTLNIAKEGFEDEELNISVYRSMYAMSLAVNRLLDSEIRAKYIADDRANLRFYYLPNCSLCKIMEPKVAKIVNEHRDCIVYEHISMWIYNNDPEIKNQFAGKLTPVIRIVGSKANYETQGLVSPESLLDMIRNAAPQCMEQ